MSKINVLIIGNGHYSTGMTVISDKRSTDKDSGVLLPSVLALRSEGLVGEICIAARDGAKLLRLKERLSAWKEKYGWHDAIGFYPAEGQIDEKAYIKALSEMPRPCAALIAVPDHLHKDVMLECIRQEVPFFIVKPAVVRLDDLYAVLEEMTRKRIFGMVDYHKVFDEANLLLKSEYLSGSYGNLHHVYSLMTQRRDMLEIYKRWLETDTDFNINHYLGSHYIHLVGFISRAEPIDVRATAQFGYAADSIKREIVDMVETQIRWIDSAGHEFTSYHISGWNDPIETESMTYQEVHFLFENGRIDSDQRYRGFRKITAGGSYETPNPYFFNLNRNPLGDLSLNTKYGYISVKTFVQTAIDIRNGKRTAEEMDHLLPTISESERVTSILEAADLSMKNNSRVVQIVKRNGRYCTV